MADTVGTVPGTDTSNDKRTSPPKKRPPKLRRRVDPATESTGENGEMSGEPSYPEAPSASGRDIASTASDSDAAEGHNNEPEPPEAEAGDQVGPSRAEQSSARPTSVRDRPRTASVGNWQKQARGKRGNQDLVPLGGIDEVGKTVNGAVGAVHDVGSNAVRSAGNTLGKVTGDAVGSLANEEKGKDEQLRLRLDLNLDIEVQLKAKIHGDLTLQLL